MSEELMNYDSPFGDSPTVASEVEAVETAIGDLLEEAPKLGEALPAGTYSFKLAGYKEGWNEPDKNDPNALLLGKQPYFQLFWDCTEEPHTGKRFMEFVPYINKMTIVQANQGNPVAVALVRNNLSRIKDICVAANYPQKGFDFKAFAATKPEVKIQLNLREKKEKSATGELKSTGEQVNFAIRHVSLHRPA